MSQPSVAAGSRDKAAVMQNGTTAHLPGFSPFSELCSIIVTSGFAAEEIKVTGLSRKPPVLPNKKRLLSDKTNTLLSLGGVDM